MSVNRQIVVAERPRYITPTVNCFKLQEAGVPTPGEGELRVRTLWLSLDPYLHGRLKRQSAQAEPVPIGDVMVGATVGRVEASRHPGFEEGDLVIGFWGWQDYAISDGQRLRKLDAGMTHPSHALGALGLPGFGAYIALTELGHAKPGETVVVGAATGALGQIAGQIAKVKGCRVIGICGNDDKCRLATDSLGYDVCLNRQAADFAERLGAACPEGIDIDVETVGGPVFEAILPLMNNHGRIVVCGQMALYSATSLPKGPDRTPLFLNQIIMKRLEVRGLVVFDHLGQHFGDFQREMNDWIASGEVVPVEDVVEGLEAAPRALQGMFEGHNRGKLVVRVGE